MKARLFLFLLILALTTVIYTNDRYEIFNPIGIEINQKEVLLNSEILIALIVLCTLLVVLIIGLVEKVFFLRKTKKGEKE